MTNRLTPGQRRRAGRDQHIAALYRGGLSERDIAMRVGLSASRVHAILERLEVASPRKSERRKIARPSMN